MSSLNNEEQKKTIIGGVPVPWDEDPDLGEETAPAYEFPLPEKTPRPNPPRRNEKIQVARYRTLRDRIHDGPIYTVLGHGVRVGKALPPAAATFNPFEDQPTYSSQKFRKHRHKLPQLHTRPYVMEFFPKELHSTLDPIRKDDDDGHTKDLPKKLSISLGSKLSRLEQFDEEEAEKCTAGKSDNLENERRDVLADDDEEGEQRDEELEAQLQDDDFDDAEADDYEMNHFDNGEDFDPLDGDAADGFGGDEDF